MLHLIRTCVVDQHYIRSALAGDKSLQTMAMSAQDVLYPPPFDYHLPESLATACQLGHALHYPKEFDPSNLFITEQVLCHNFDPRIDPYSDGNHNYKDDCHFLDAFEVHTLFENDSRAFSDPALDSIDDGGWGPLKGSKSHETDFSVKAKHSKVKPGVSHLPLHQPGSREYDAARKRMQRFTIRRPLKTKTKVRK